MKKILLLLVLTMSLLATAHAGFNIRGIDTSDAPDNLKNFTLALNNNEPISAGAMYTIDGGGIGRNSIVIIPADTNVSATYFPFTFGPDEEFSFEVRDFHYDATNNLYILCGSRENDIDTFAFLAVINIASATMDYYEYTDADIFYSMCAPNDYLSDYYVCGKSGNYGAIASISKNSLQFTNLFITDYEWVCHKIIENPSNSIEPRFAISGRNPEGTLVGYTAIDPSFTLGVTYFWDQLSELDAHCVVCVDVTDNNIILATSHQNRVTLNRVLSSGTPQVGVQHYYFTPNTNFYVQDIGMTDIHDSPDSLISIAGYMTDGTSLQHQAWYGFVNRLNNATSPIISKNYYQADGQYEHYKIRYNQYGKLYTGGYFQGDNSMCALFGTPQQISEKCDINEESIYLAREQVYILSLALPEQIGEPQISISSSQQDIEMPVYFECEP